MSREPRERLIVALDSGDPETSLRLARQLAQWVGTFKFTPDAIMSDGPRLIKEIKALGRGVFLDMKLYDIPETVRRACRTASALGVDMMTIHVGGGARMLAAAREGADEGAGRLKLIGVTVLTSFAQEELEEYWNMRESIRDRVLAWAALARKAGLDGIVCSPLELAPLRGKLGKDLLAVVPGIRGSGDPPSDQRRTMSAGEAVAAGADYLVVGRPIIRASDPAAAAQSILSQIEKAQ